VYILSVPTLEELAAAHRQIEQQEQLLQKCMVQLAEAHRAAERARRESAEANLRWQSRLAEAGLTFQQADQRLRRQQEELGQLQRELVRMAHQSELRGAELTRAQARMAQLEQRLLQAEQVMAGDAAPPRPEPGVQEREECEASTIGIAALQARVIELEAERGLRDAEQTVLERERAERERELAALRLRNGPLEARCAERERELGELRSLHDDKLAALRAEHEAELVALRVEHDAKLAALRAEHEAELVALRVQIEAERAKHAALEGARAEQERELVALRSQRVAAARERASTSRERSAPAPVQAVPQATGVAPLELAGRLFDRAADLFMPVGSRRRAMLRRFAFGRRR